MIKRLLKHGYRWSRRVYKKRPPLSEVPDIEDKRFLFIGGLHRSGTSILHRLLREHPLVSGFDDTGVMEDEGQHLQTVFETAHHYGGPGEFAFASAAHLTENSKLISVHNRETLLREWGAYYDLRKQVLLEKSPPNLIRSRFFRQLFPGSRFVFIVRHPVAVALATGKWTEASVEERLLHWHKAHSIMLDDTSACEDCLIIRYEDLVSDPVKYIDKICTMVDIPLYKPVEKVADHNEKYFLQWQNNQCSSKIINAYSETVNTDILTHFGYSLNEPYVQAGYDLNQ